MRSNTDEFIINTYSSFVIIFLFTWVLVLLNVCHILPYIYLSFFVYFSLLHLKIYLLNLLAKKLNK